MFVKFLKKVDDKLKAFIYTNSTIVSLKLGWMTFITIRRLGGSTKVAWVISSVVADLVYCLVSALIVYAVAIAIGLPSALILVHFFGDSLRSFLASNPFTSHLLILLDGGVEV